MQFRPLHDRILVRRTDADEKTFAGVFLMSHSLTVLSADPVTT